MFLEIITIHFGSKILKDSRKNESLERSTILGVYVGSFSAQLPKVNDTGCGLLLASFVRSIKTA